MPTPLTQTQLEGIQKIIALKNDFAAPFNPQQSRLMDNLVNIFCTHDLPDNNYISIHLEASQYNNKELFVNAPIEKLLKHLTYIIWTDKLVDNYLPARIKDMTIYLILERLSVLEPLILILTPSTEEAR
jgi:hypothetical protein